MMEFITQNGKAHCQAKITGAGVYLDTFALIKLAKQSDSRRKRFVDALRTRGTLMFSWANAMELAGPQGKSADAVRAFLDSIGPHWVPLASDPWVVASRERRGFLKQSPLSETFVNSYIRSRIEELSPGTDRVIDLSKTNFFRLGAVVDWVHVKRDEVRDSGPDLDHELRTRIERLHAESVRDPNCLDKRLPSIPFDERHPALYVLRHLQRMLVLQKKAFHFKAHDGQDFCHAVLAAAYAKLATLDKGWKRRVENLPNATRFARIYYEPQLDQLVSDLESHPHAT